jgi:hypothetical protein
MNNRQSRAFRPGLEFAEDRCLATVHPLVSHLGHPALHAAVHRSAQVHQSTGPITAAGHNGHRAVHHPGRPGASRPPVVMFGGGGSTGQGTLPSNYRDWGVITLWNTTNQKVTFSVSASTYQSGRYFNFTLGPGQYQSYYATFDDFNNAPAFHVSFDPIHQVNSIQLGNINTVFEKTTWYPRVGTEGYPYAIAIDVSGYHLVPI